MTTFHLAGFPRVGAKRELKFAQGGKPGGSGKYPADV